MTDKTETTTPEVNPVRVAALGYALAIAQIGGIDCEACVLGFAKKAETYLLTGEVPEHEEPEVEFDIETQPLN